MRFLCPHCQKTIRAPESQAGKQASCPACGEAIAIPSTTSSPPEGNGIDSSRPVVGKRRRPWLAFSLAGILLLAAAGVTAHYLLNRQGFEEPLSLPAVSLYNTSSENFVARTRALPGDVLRQWRDALQDATREYVTRQELLFAMLNMDSLWGDGQFDLDIAATLEQRIAAVPRAHILRWHRALDIAGERTGRIPLWDTVLRLVEIDRIFQGHSFDLQASDSLLERFRAVSQKDFARWAAALDAERGQSAIMLVCTDGFFENEAFAVQRFHRGAASVERLRKESG